MDQLPESRFPRCLAVGFPIVALPAGAVWRTRDPSAVSITIGAIATEDGQALTDLIAPPNPLHVEQSPPTSELGRSLYLRSMVSTATDGSAADAEPVPGRCSTAVDRFGVEVLVVPSSERWRQAVSTALLGNWCYPLLQSWHMPDSALGVLRAEARELHRQLVPLWRRRTRRGRVLSLDADLGGLSLHDLVAADIDHLTHTTGGVFDDERLNAVLRGLNAAERAVVFAYAEGEGTTWTEKPYLNRT